MNEWTTNKQINERKIVYFVQQHSFHSICNFTLGILSIQSTKRGGVTSTQTNDDGLFLNKQANDGLYFPTTQFLQFFLQFLQWE